jgi:hypothetical protein
MKNPLLLINAICLGLLCGTAGAQSPQPLETSIHEYLAEIGQSCVGHYENRALEPGTDTKLAYAMRDFYWHVCECMPSRLKAYLDGLSPLGRARTVTELEFNEVQQAAAMNPCAGDMIKRPFESHCEDRHKDAKGIAEVPKFCGCMRKYLAGLTDAEAQEIGVQVAAHQLGKEEATANGKPAPPLPIAVENFNAIRAKCRMD